MKEKVRSDCISSNKSNVTFYMQHKEQILNKFVKKISFYACKFWLVYKHWVNMAVHPEIKHRLGANVQSFLGFSCND